MLQLFKSSALVSAAISVYMLERTFSEKVLNDHQCTSSALVDVVTGQHLKFHEEDLRAMSSNCTQTSWDPRKVCRLRSACWRRWWWTSSYSNVWEVCNLPPDQLFTLFTFLVERETFSSPRSSMYWGLVSAVHKLAGNRCWMYPKIKKLSESVWRDLQNQCP